MYTLDLSAQLICVGETYLPAPTKYDVQYSDLDSSDTTRNEDGKLIRNRVRSGVVKILLEFLVDGTKAASIMKLVEPAKVSVTYIDVMTATRKTADMYVGDRSCTMKRYVGGDGLSNILWQVSFNLVEY